MRRITFSVEPKEEGRQLKNVVFARLHIGRRLFSSVKFQNGLLLDGAPAHADQRVQSGQTITLCLPEDDPVRRPLQKLPLSIAYEDEDVLVVVKPAPLPSQSSARQGTDTLENRIAAYLTRDGRFVYRPVNRLDKGVSGLMVIAKNAYAQQQLQNQLHTPDFVREYLAVAEGILQPPAGTIDAPIAKLKPGGIKRCISIEGKSSVTHYEMLGTDGIRSLIKLRLETGRTHQIRVHLQYAGCPVTGDFLYGLETEELPGRLALHSFSVRFLQPVTGKQIALSTPLPAELKELMKGNMDELFVKKQIEGRL